MEMGTKPIIVSMCTEYLTETSSPLLPLVFQNTVAIYPSGRQILNLFLRGSLASPEGMTLRY